MNKRLSAILSILTISTLLLFLTLLSPVSAQEVAAFTGEIYDEGVDSDDDGYFNYLNLGIEVNVTVPATYIVSVSGIYDSSDASATIYVENSTYLDAGINVVYLAVNGTSIYASGLDPFAARGINIYNENNIQVDVLSKIPFSNEYAYSDFQHEVEQMASLTGVIYDEGVDTDDDGYFNYLNLGIEVNVTVPATYIVSVSGIYDSSFTSASVQTENPTYLDAGVKIVYLEMDGMSIYASELDPFAVATVRIYDENETLLDTTSEIEFSREYLYTEFQPTVFEQVFRNMEREIFLDQLGNIYVTNAYRIENIGYEITEIEIGLPEGTYNVVVRDEMGELEATVEENVVRVPFRELLNTSEMETLYLAYRVPWNFTVGQQNGINYNVQFNFCEGINSTIESLDVSIILPKGAVLQSSSPPAGSTKKRGFQETLAFTFSQVEPSEELSFTIDYKHLLVWDSLYPTVWIGLAVVAVTLLSVFWKAPKLSAVPAVQISPKDLKSFVDFYDEKTRIKSELESLEARLKKGKVSRRRYKVRRRMLEGRLTAINRKLSSLSDVIRSGGSQYSSLMRQIEVAETKLDGTERDIQRLELRYKQGEISKGAYGKLMEEYRNRVEEAETTIEGTLLRLRE